MASTRKAGYYRLLTGLGALYLAQGVISAFGSNVLLPQLAATGIAIEDQVSLLMWGGAPWVFKLVWALVLDAFFGPNTGSLRRVLLIGLQLVCTCFAGWLALTPATPAHLTTLTWIWVLLNLAASLQDVTTDGVALDLLAPDERGAGNTWMQTGLRIGQLGLGGLLLATLTVSQGLEAATKIWVAILGLCVLGPALLPTARLVASARQPRAPLREVFQRFKFGPMLGAAVLALLAMVASAVTSAVAPTFLFQELGLTFADYTRTLLPLMLVFTLVAAPVSTRLISRAGAHYAYALSTFALGAVWIAFGLAEPWWSARATLLLLVSVEAIATVLCFSALYALLMAHTDSRVRATHFALFMMALNLGRALSPGVAPDLLASLGYAGVWIVCGVGQACLLVPAWLLRQHTTPMQTGAEESPGATNGTRE